MKDKIIIVSFYKIKKNIYIHMSSFFGWVLSVFLYYWGFWLYLSFGKPCYRASDDTSTRAKNYQFPLITSSIVAGSVLLGLIVGRCPAGYVIGSFFLSLIFSFLIMYMYGIWVGNLMKQDICPAGENNEKSNNDTYIESLKQSGILFGFSLIGIIGTALLMKLFSSIGTQSSSLSDKHLSHFEEINRNLDSSSTHSSSTHSSSNP
jgi:hypothetical protein